MWIRQFFKKISNRSNFLIIDFSFFTVKNEVFPALCILISESPNFKVRTNAAWALGSCDKYETFIPKLWKTIADGLENSQRVPSHMEYPHRDVLVQQVTNYCWINTKISPKIMKLD